MATKCKKCKDGAVDCPVCKGKGQLAAFMGGSHKCKNCEGSGQVKCPVCKGKIYI